MLGLYVLTDRHGKSHLMSATSIYKRVMDDNYESNYNWVASATDLIAACNKKIFSKERENAIKVAILNCYSSLIWDESDYPKRKSTDFSAVYFAYNSLYGVKDAKVIAAREIFLRSFISLSAKFSSLFMVHSGENFRIVEACWEGQMFKKLFMQEQIDFVELFYSLANDFGQIITQLEREGIITFKEELVTGAPRVLTNPIKG